MSNKSENNYETLSDFFECISDQEYLVLRNYEEFENDGYLEEHPDIDILCRSVEQIKEKAHLFPKGQKEDGLHYAAYISGNRVPIDLRHVGDGYFDTAWQEDVLSRRIKPDGYYVMEPRDYFYTLLYHACIHKELISSDYAERFLKMAEELNIDYSAEKRYNILNDYLKKNGYKYTYPKAVTTNAHLDGVDKSLIKFSMLHLLRTANRKSRRFAKNILWGLKNIGRKNS